MASNVQQTNNDALVLSDDLCKRLHLSYEVMSELRPELRIKVLHQAAIHQQEFDSMGINSKQRIITCLDLVFTKIHSDIANVKNLITNLPRDLLRETKREVTGNHIHDKEVNIEVAKYRSIGTQTNNYVEMEGDAATYVEVLTGMEAGFARLEAVVDRLEAFLDGMFTTRSSSSHESDSDFEMVQRVDSHTA